jgi:glycosidase
MFGTIIRKFRSLRKRTQIISIALAAIVAVAGTNFAINAALAATSSNDSNESLHFFVGGSYNDGSSALNWTSNVIASNSTTNIEAPFSCPSDSTGVYAFLSSRGDERKGVGAWKAYIVTTFIQGTTNAFEINLKPSGLISGSPGSQVIKGTGGDYSLGIACTTSNGQQVNYASYRLITVTAGTGSWTAQPAPVINSGLTSTQLSVSASSYAVTDATAVTLTANLTPAFANATISFSDGSTVLGTAKTNASGVATFQVNSFSAGSHTITTSFAGDSTYKSSSSSAISITSSAVVNPTPTPTPTETTPPAPIVAVTPPSWIYGATVYQVNPRVFTAAGNFAGFKQQIPRLKGLGVKVISFLPLTPISTGPKHQGTLGSLYAVDDYQDVNSEFGTAAEFTNLVTYLHNQGMKVVVGWNAQATGWDNNWIVDHPTWYKKAGNTILSPDGGANVDKALLDYSNSSMRLAMIAALKYWVSTYGVDGFSCSNVAAIPTDFWDRAIAEVNAVKPTFWMADSFTNSALFVNSFAAGYNNAFATTLATISSKAAKLAPFSNALNSIVAPSSNVAMPINFVTTDQINATSGSEVSRFGLANSKVVSILSFTAPGTPMIYNGQEIGSTKKLKLYDKDTIKWPTSSATANFYKSLISLKSRNQALWTGPTQSAAQLIPTSNPNVLAYQRVSASNRVLVFLNLSAKAQKVSAFLTSKPGKVFALAASKATTLGTSIKLSLVANGYAVFSTAATN